MATYKGPQTSRSPPMASEVPSSQVMKIRNPNGINVKFQRGSDIIIIIIIVVIIIIIIIIYCGINKFKLTEPFLTTNQTL